MTKLAVAGNDAFAVDDREMRRSGPTYTVDTLEELAREGMIRPYFIVGADALGDMRHWWRPERIGELASIVIAPRPGAGAAGHRYVELDMAAVSINSTDIRRRVREGLSVRYYVTEPVASYIRHHGLYR
jgi:nicotinate-nucleotide adenylyltransferase